MKENKSLLKKVFLFILIINLFSVVAYSQSNELHKVPVETIVAEIAQGSDWESTLRYATAASAICVTKKAAQLSIPKELEVRIFLNENKFSAQNLKILNRI